MKVRFFILTVLFALVFPGLAMSRDWQDRGYSNAYRSGWATDWKGMYGDRYRSEPWSVRKYGTFHGGNPLYGGYYEPGIRYFGTSRYYDPRRHHDSGRYFGTRRYGTQPYYRGWSRPYGTPYGTHRYYYSQPGHKFYTPRWYRDWDGSGRGSLRSGDPAWRRHQRSLDQRMFRGRVR